MSLADKTKGIATVTMNNDENTTSMFEYAKEKIQNAAIKGKRKVPFVNVYKCGSTSYSQKELLKEKLKQNGFRFAYGTEYGNTETLYIMW